MYLGDDDTGVKPEKILPIGMRCTPGYNPIQQKWYRDSKISRVNVGKKEINWIYLSSWFKTS